MWKLIREMTIKNDVAFDKTVSQEPKTNGLQVKEKECVVAVYMLATYSVVPTSSMQLVLLP
jgi:hypothetical protein